MLTIPANTYPLVMQALTLIGQGHTLTAACDRVGLSVATFQGAIRTNRALGELFTAEEQRGYDRMADALLTIDTDKTYGTTDPKIMKIISDNIKWYLTKKRPQQYGERVIVENTITADRAIIEALERGKQRAMGVVVDAVAYEVAQDVLTLAPPQFDDLSEFV